MKTNNFLTILLYVLLLGLIAAAGYKACQMKKEKQEMRAQQEAELQKALQDMRLSSNDTAASEGSTYSNDNEKSTTTSKDGIEDDPEPQKPVTSTNNTPTKQTTPAATKPTAPAASKSLAPAQAPATTTAKPAVKSTPKSYKYRVQAGSFTQMEGARRRLEEVIKMGYTNAEIGKTNNGKFAVVIVFKTNDKAEAIRVSDKLENKGIDAAVMTNN